MLCLKHVFGVKPGVQDGIAYLNETDVIYACGCNMVIHNSEQNIQRFIGPSPDASLDITCMAVSPSLKLVAVADSSSSTDQEHPAIAVYDLATFKRRRQLITTEMFSKHHTCLSFSADSKFLLAQGAAPDFTLVLWQWEKNKVLCIGRVSAGPDLPVFEASLCPFESNACAVIGASCLKFLRNGGDGTWKPAGTGLGKRDADDCLSHCWLPGERCVVGTELGSLLLFESHDFRTALPEPEESRGAISKIVPYKRGFVCSCPSGVVRVFDRSAERLQYFSEISVVTVDGVGPLDTISSLCVSPNHESLLLLLNTSEHTGQLLSLAFSSIEYSKHETVRGEPVGALLHLDKITGIGVCAQRPIVATTSTDRTVRLWEYNDLTLIYKKEFAEEAHCVSIHPSSFYLLVGFSDKLRMLTVLMEDLKVAREFPIKNCRVCEFAGGGHVFAAGHNNNIQLYDTYTGELLCNMRGHSARVKSLCFNQRDHVLYSAGMDGGVHEWCVRTGDMSAEAGGVLKTCNYNAVVADSVGRMICAGNDGVLRVYTGVTVTTEIELDVTITKMHLAKSERVLYAGCSTGALRVYTYPLSGEFEEHRLHLKPISGLCVSTEDALVYTVAIDGSIAVHNVMAESRRSEKKDTVQWVQEVLVGKVELEEKAASLKEEQTHVARLISQNEYQLKIEQKKSEEGIKQLSVEFESNLSSEQARYNYMISEKNDMEMAFEEKLRHQEERHTSFLRETESQYEVQLLSQGQQLRQAEQSKEAETTKYEEQHEMMIEQHDRYLADIQEENEERINKQEKEIRRMMGESDEQGQLLVTATTMIEEDCDTEIVNLKMHFDKRLEREKEILLQLKGDNGLIKKRNLQLNKKYNEQEARIRDVNDRADEMEQKLEVAKRDIQALKKETKERDESIGDKEKRIYELKKKNQELEKFKFVLDYKIKELRKQIEPKELEIAGMKETVTEMDAELDRYNKINQALELDNVSMQSKLEAAQKQALRQRNEHLEAANLNNRFRGDLEETVQYIQDYKMLKASVKLLYQRHCGEVQNKASVNDELNKELFRQREYLEKSVDNLKKKLVKDSTQASYQSRRHMNDNSLLIKEINDLRREIKNLKAQNGRIVADMNFKKLDGSEKPQRPQSAAPRIGASPSGRVRPGAKNNEVEMLHNEIFRLRQHVAELEEQNDVNDRPNANNPGNAWLETSAS